MNKDKLFSILKYLLFVSFGAGLFYYVFHDQQEIYRAECMQDPSLGGNCSLWDKLVQDIKKLNPLLISLVGVGFIISNIMRARRWVIMLQPLNIKASLWETYWTVHLGYFTNLALPRMGELARAGTLSKRLKAPLEVVLGTIITDRLLDLLLLSLFTGLAFLLQTSTLYNFLSKKASISIWHLIIIGLLGLVGVLFIIYLFKTDKIYHPFIIKLKNKIAGLLKGITSLSKSNKPIELALLSIGIWLMYYFMTMLGLKAFSPTAGITFTQGLVVFVMGSLGMVVPTPGGIGPFHFLTMSALGIFGIATIDGFSYANLSFVLIQVITISVFGIIGMTLLARSKPKS